jgi:capsular exopolysaccharide synthesis family protein
MPARSSILDEGNLGMPSPDRVRPGAEETLVERGVRLLRNRWLLVLQAMIIVPLAAFILSSLQDERWTATSSLVFQPARQNSGSVDLTRQAATQTELVGLPVVADRTASAMGAGWTPREVRDAVEVSAPGDTNLVDVVATTPSPRTAAKLADAYAAAFIDLQVASNVQDAQARLNALDAYLNTLPPEERSGPRGIALQQRVDTLRISQALQSNDQRPSAQLAQRAELPTSPSAPKPVRNVILGVLLGTVLGLALAALIERLDRAVKDVDELERIYGLPVLARIPHTRALGKRLRRHGAGEVLRQGSEAEAFRGLRASLRYFNVDGSLGSLLVVSPEAEDGKSTVVACLATTLVQRGDRVILVETDLHKEHGGHGAGTTPAEAVGAGASHPVGLSTVLAGGELDDAIVSVDIWTGDGEIAGLAVLPAGPRPPNPSQLLESARMREVVKELEQRYDMVIYDSPAMGAVNDALALSHAVDGVIVVNRLRYTSRDRARELVKQLALQRANVLGLVANYASLPKRRGYDYYHA